MGLPRSGKRGVALYSSLSRYLLTYGVNQAVWSEQESRILRIFKRKAHLLLEHLPDEDDSFEWLALMQHHGAPTRLLDFTWSPFVAAFFALERATSQAMPGLLDTPIEKLVKPTAIIKFELDAESIRAEAMAELYSMNISNATLFPGLDGLARSLGYELEFHWAFDPRSTEGRAGFSIK